MRLKTRIIILTGMVLIIATLLLGFAAFRAQEKAILSGIDAKLEATALLAREILPTDYHDRISGPDSVSEVEYLQIVDRWNRLCKQMGLEYIWSLIRIDGKTVFTSGSSTSKDVRQGDHANFLETHSNPQAYDAAFATMEPQHQIINDKWGNIRVVLLPFKDARERPFLFGASMKMAEVDALIRKTIWQSLAIGTGILFAGVFLNLMLAGSLVRPLEKLRNLAESITKGNWGQVIELSGTAEIRSLAHSVNVMSLSIQEKITEAQDREEALRESEANLREAQEIARLGRWQLDMPTNRLVWSDGLFALFEVNPETRVSSYEAFLTYVHPDDRALVNQTYREAVEYKTPYEIEHRLLMPDGRIKWVSEIGRIEYDEAGTPIRSVGTAQDITERKRTEDALIEQADFNQRVFDTTNAHLVVVGPDGVILRTNSAWRRFADENGWKSGCAGGVGTGYFVDYKEEWGDTEHAREAFDGIRKVQRGQLQQFSLEYRCNALGNEKRWFAMHVLPLMGRKGTVLISHTNITERILVTEALVRSQMELKAIYDNVSTMICLVDANRRIRYANPALTTFMAVSEDDLKNGCACGVFGCINALDDPRGCGFGTNCRNCALRLAMEDTLQNGTKYHNVEYHATLVRDGNRREITLLGSTALIHTEDQKHLLVCLHDITERKQADEALRKSERFSKEIQHIARVGGWMANPHTNYLKWTDGIYEIVEAPLDYVPDLVDGMKFYKDQYIPIIKHGLAHCLATGEPFTIECEVITTSGKQLWIELRGLAPVVEGERFSVIGTFQDITERKRVEDVLRLQSLVLNQIQDQVTVTDLDGVITYVNEAECKIFQCSYETLVGKHVEVFGEDSMRSATQREIIEHTLSVGGWRGEVVNYALDGTEYIMDYRTQLVRDAEGRAVALCGISTDITKRKRAEEALRDNEERLRITVEAGNIGLWDWDLCTNRIHISPMWKQQIGYEDHEISDDFDEWRSRVHPEDLDRAMAHVWAFINSPYPNFENEFRFRHKNGSYRTILARASLYYDENGKPVRMCGSHSDITERKRAEEVLRESEYKLSEAQRIAHVGSWELDIRTHALWWSDETFRLFGFHKGEFNPTMEAFFECVHPDDQSMMNAVTQAAWYERKPFDVEHRIICPDGTERTVHEIAETVFDDAGTPVRMIGTVHDITDRKRAEEELLKSEEHLIRAELMGEFGSWEINLDTGMVSASEGAHSIYGALDGALTLDLIQKVPLFEYRTMLDDALRGLLAGNKPYDVEFKIKRESDGAIVDIHSIARYDKKSNMIFGVIQDVTARKRAQEANSKLEFQLQQAQKMESVGRLAGGVAHDFNNMLQVILNYTSVALDSVDPALPLHADLVEIRKEAERSADLTRQLLAFARKQTIAPKILNPNETIEGMLKMLRRLIGEDIDLTWKPGLDVWPVMVDPSQIDQILANLCVNARDAIADVGKITIETGNKVVDENYCEEHSGFMPGSYVRIAVSDNGCGIDRTMLENIFEPFFTTKGFGEGTGLGLATVYGIVKQNSGFINVSSEQDKGTTFSIYLPRHEGEAVQMRTEGPEEPILQGHETILLVEDEPGILKGVKRLLETLGYQVLGASTPGEAICLAQECAGEIHLLMTDVIMPDMNGRDLARKLLACYPHLRSLFMSGYTADVIAHHGVLDEGVHFIQKPFSTKKLAAKIREVLGK